MNNSFSSDELQFDDFENFDLNDFSTEDVQVSTNVNEERNLNFFKHIPVTLTLEVASKELPLSELMKAGEGSVIELDKLNGEPLDVKINGTLMGHAEIVIVNDKYGLRLTDVVDSPLNSITE